MIRGIVTVDREAIIQLTVRGAGGRHRRIEAVIDTGFNGWLTLPPALIASLRLPWRRRGRALLGDGSNSVFDIYEASVVWDKRHRRVPIDEADTMPLIGMALLEGHELSIDVRVGGPVKIRRKP